jgi:hypothetical protein
MKKIICIESPPRNSFHTIIAERPPFYLSLLDTFIEYQVPMEVSMTTDTKVQTVPVGFVFNDHYSARDWYRNWLIDSYYNHRAPLRSNETFEIWECQVSSMGTAVILSLPDLFTKGFGYMKEWVQNVKKQKLSIYEFILRYEKAIRIQRSLSGAGPAGGYLARNIKLLAKVS